jgi:hypothetical protein
MNDIPVLAFKCPSKRSKAGSVLSTCDGLMACQLLDSQQGKFLVYCPKCAQFYLAIPADGIYRLTKVHKSKIKFISQPAFVEDDQNAIE